jgi:hypothetical protein
MNSDQRSRAHSANWGRILEGSLLQLKSNALSPERKTLFVPPDTANKISQEAWSALWRRGGIIGRGVVLLQKLVHLLQRLFVPVEDLEVIDGG